MIPPDRSPAAAPEPAPLPPLPPLPQLPQLTPMARLAPRRWRPSPLLVASGGLHVAALAALAAAPRHWPLTALALGGNHVALSAVGLWPASSWLGPNLRRLPASAARRGEVALTFDDGPDPRVTPAVLDELDRGGARASFFCIGRRAASHAELTAELARRGHRVENHSFTHSNAFSLFLPAAQRREIQRCQEGLRRATGRWPRYFRAPAGFRNLCLERELAAAGLWLASWTRRGFDTVSRHPRRVAARLLRGLRAGDILLLHDGSAARDAGGEPVVLEALRRVLDGIAARGLRVVALPDTADQPGDESDDEIAAAAGAADHHGRPGAPARAASA